MLEPDQENSDPYWNIWKLTTEYTKEQSDTLRIYQATRPNSTQMRRYDDSYCLMIGQENDVYSHKRQWIYLSDTDLDDLVTTLQYLQHERDNNAGV